jgi:hypothetical protein
MPWYLVEVWAGREDRRWNTHSMTVTAGSVEEARQTVAECLGLAPAHWQGQDPPLELVVPSTSPSPEGSGHPRPGRRLVRKFGSERRDIAAGTTEAVGAWIRLVESLADQTR